ncbi:hypothetical protein TSTA_108750 [Talaromyces stipitatus ATCC 10500]|uniref:Uncharacterized protein n=1 Tax=Talaromyces stipitatus (strain ATCC 10500 / CBS 375.48 / QM 6759 / NRRL 1006) TaxID=441959 RepID=B8MUM1_TALSN|nr:uncharacterized protein TSTA_108750 [Talaromyces stipitatus ATCC 10500]EED11689.1 hypothetical protein TSTA_108750 [Talaromyces stipitatus ATCC 10500]
MGAEPSKQIAERVITACQSVNDNEQISGILLEDKIFRQTLARLSQDIPPSLRQLIKLKRERQRQDYGGPEITEHRAFNSIWAASEPKLQPVIRQFLFACHKDPRQALRRTGTNPERISIADYLDALYDLEKDRKINTVRWRLSLIPLSDLIHKFDRANSHAQTRDDIVTVISQSSLTIQNEVEIRKYLPSWLQRGKRYKTLAPKIGYGGICALPEEPGDTIWEQFLPKKGAVTDACIRLLVDRGIKEAASENVAENEQDIVTADAAAEKIVQYLGGLIDDFPFLDDGDRHSCKKRKRNSRCFRDEPRLSPAQPTSSASQYYQDAPSLVPNERGSLDRSPSQRAGDALSAEEETPSNSGDLGTSPSDTSMSYDSPDISISGANFDFHAAQILSQISRDSAADNVPINNGEWSVGVNDVREGIEIVADVNTANSGCTASRIVESTGSLNRSYGAAGTQPENVGADGNIAVTNRQVHHHPRSTAEGMTLMGSYDSILPEQAIPRPSIRPHQLNISFRQRTLPLPLNSVSSPPISDVYMGGQIPNATLFSSTQHLHRTEASALGERYPHLEQNPSATGDAIIHVVPQSDLHAGSFPSTNNTAQPGLAYNIPVGPFGYSNTNLTLEDYGVPYTPEGLSQYSNTNLTLEDYGVPYTLEGLSQYSNTNLTLEDYGVPYTLEGLSQYSNTNLTLGDPVHSGNRNSPSEGSHCTLVV